MKRKDIELIASVIRNDVATLVARQHFADVFAKALAAHDANFNRDKFMLACLGKNAVRDLAAVNTGETNG